MQVNLTSLKKYFNKIKRHYLFPHFLGAIVLILFLIVLLSLILKAYTFHNSELTLPDLKFKHVNKVTQLLHEMKLRPYIFDSTYVKNLEPGIVIDQHPDAGSKVKKKRKIYLTINAHRPQKVVMPDVVQLPLKQAIAVLQRNGLEVGRVIYQPDIGVNIVLDQRIGGKRINPGETIYKNTFIDLVVGMGLSAEYSNIPDLIGLTLDEAKLIVAENYFNIGAIIYDDNCLNDFKNNAVIYKQRPEYNNDKKLPLGSSIDIWLTCDSLFSKKVSDE